MHGGAVAKARLEWIRRGEATRRFATALLGAEAIRRGVEPQGSELIRRGGEAIRRGIAKATI